MDTVNFTQIPLQSTVSLSFGGQFKDSPSQRLQQYTDSTIAAILKNDPTLFPEPFKDPISQLQLLDSLFQDAQIKNPTASAYQYHDETGAATNWTNFYGRGVQVTGQDKLEARLEFDRIHPNFIGKSLAKGGEQAKELAFIEKIIAQNKYNKIIADSVAQFPEIKPKILKSLLIQESNLNPSVVNSFGYAGIAQFGRSASKDINLNINNVVDERLDPQKAIPGAARLLNKKSKWLKDYAYTKYGTPKNTEQIKFTLASYNAGEGVIRNAMRIAYKNALAEATNKGLGQNDAVAQAQNYASKWDNLLQPKNDVTLSALYQACIDAKYNPVDKYAEIGNYPTDILKMADQ